MRRSNNSKALYNFTKKQKLKDSTSTKDLDDSLEHQEITSQNQLQSPHKQPHHRTQSCPFIAELNKFEYTPKSKVEKSQRYEKDGTVRSSGDKTKNKHRYCQSQAQLSSISNAQSISIENLSAVLYRKNSKEGGLKKIGALTNQKNKQFFIHNEHYSRTRLEQQMKTYELSEELKDLEKKSKGITIKQQILENLMNKF